MNASAIEETKRVEFIEKATLVLTRAILCPKSVTGIFATDLANARVRPFSELKRQCKLLDVDCKENVVIQRLKLENGSTILAFGEDQVQRMRGLSLYTAWVYEPVSKDVSDMIRGRLRPFRESDEMTLEPLFVA